MVQAWSTDFEVGLVDDYDFTITDAVFAPDVRYGTQMVLQLIGTTDNPDLAEKTELISLGTGWISNDGGKTVVHESGKDRNFNKSTTYAKWLDRCANKFNIIDVLARDNTDQFTASSWVGLIFHMKNEDTFNFDGSPTGKSKSMPESFVGVVGGGSPKGSEAVANTSTVNAISDGAAKLAAAKAANGGGNTLKDQVVAIFKANDDFDTARDLATDIDGVTDDEYLVSELIAGVDGQLWQDVKSGVTA